VEFHGFADAARRIPADKLPALRSAVMTACDELDGVKDGVIDDPQQCTFDPVTLTCEGLESSQCLARPEVETVRQLYASRLSPSGKPLVQGYARGAESGLDRTYFRSGPGTNGVFELTHGFWRDMVFEDSAWDSRSYDIERDGARAERKLAAVLDASDPDLRRFAARGGKLILYHGWSDPLVPPTGTIDYLARVGATIGSKRLNETVRLFVAPGMDHCGGGSGPNSFGEASAGSGDPDINLGAALQRWVEKGVAPERIVAVMPRQEGGRSGDVPRSRPLRACPLVSRYRGEGEGEGDPERAASFDCRTAR